jgi:hypothetical protein
MVSAVIHRRWAREFLARGTGPRRDGKLRLLRLAVANSVRAQQFEAKSASESVD